MNKERLEKIGKIVAKLSPLQSELESLRDEEQEACENMIEGEQKERAEEACNTLNEQVDALQAVIDGLESIT